LGVTSASPSVAAASLIFSFFGQRHPKATSLALLRFGSQPKLASPRTCNSPRNPVVAGGFATWHAHCDPWVEGRRGKAATQVTNSTREGEMQNPLSEYNPELETFEGEQWEWSGEGEAGILGESEEMELAAELLEIQSEEELDQFLGKLIRRVGRTVGKFVRSPIGKAVGGFLKGVVKKALPIAGGALGTFVGGPIGAKLGSSLASAAGGALGLELEGMSQEDREFEASKQFVRFASEAVKNAVSTSGDNPNAAAQAAVAAAAQRFAPGILRSTSSAMPSTSSASGRGRSGRWVRQGRNIIVVNC
jgi:hypothetical protein